VFKILSSDPLFDLLKATVALFIIVDPIGTVPIFADLTVVMDRPARDKMFRTVAYVGAGLLIAFAIVGQSLLELFGISLPSFEIAGGLLLLILSMEILFRRERFAKPPSPGETSVVPIAFPLLVGPGAITTTMITLTAYGIVVALVSILIVIFLTWVTMKLTPQMLRILGRTGSSVVAQVMAVFIAAIAIQFIIAGVKDYPKT
jgi:multiple antibiotic resistance protein